LIPQLDSTQPQHAMLITIEELGRWFDEDSAILVNLHASLLFIGKSID
jgi:hypothetical protein